MHIMHVYINYNGLWKFIVQKVIQSSTNQSITIFETFLDWIRLCVRQNDPLIIAC